MYRHGYINKTLKHEYWGVLLTNTDDSTPLPSHSSENWQSLIFHFEEQIYYLPQLTQAEAETCVRSFLSMGFLCTLNVCPVKTNIYFEYP